MKTYRIEFSDRQRCRHITADDAASAVRQARRDILTARLGTWSDAALTYVLAVQTGPTSHGATPFRNICATVTIEE